MQQANVAAPATSAIGTTIKEHCQWELFCNCLRMKLGVAAAEILVKDRLDWTWQVAAAADRLLQWRVMIVLFGRSWQQYSASNC
jgi:hypothetical protein